MNITILKRMAFILILGLLCFQFKHELPNTLLIQNAILIDGSGSDSGCDTSSDPLIDAGIWAEDTYVNMGSVDGIRLNSNGNNDEAVTDWAAIPEFGTLLMPIASVLLIVGYNYRRKEQLES